MERTMKSKVLSLLLIFWLVFMLIFPIGTIESKAVGGATYILPVTYNTSATETTTVDVYMVMSTTTIMPGTEITLIGIPSNSYISGGGYEHVGIHEFLSDPTTWVTWGYDYWDGLGEEIVDGTVTFTVPEGKNSIDIIFGEWFDGENGGGSDNLYIIELNGIVTNFDTKEIILPIGDDTALETLNIIP